MTDNPETANDAAPAAATLSEYRVYHLARGLKFINYAFLALMVTIVAAVLLGEVLNPDIAGPVVYAVLIAALIAGALGLVHALNGLGAKKVTIVFCIIGMVVTPLNLIILAVVLAKASRQLKQAGYRVGLLGLKQ